MEPFYDGDLKDIWDSDLDPTDTLKMSTDTDMHDWFLERDVKDPTVILNDKLISDALFNGSQPIKSEHSYSLNSDGDSLPESPRSLQTRIDDMEDECYPAISLKTATSNLHHADVNATATIDPKCLTISPSTSMSCSPAAVIVTSLNNSNTINAISSNTTANSNNNSAASTTAHCQPLILPLHGSVMGSNGGGIFENALNKMSNTTATTLSYNLRSIENSNLNNNNHHNNHISGDSGCNTITISKAAAAAIAANVDHEAHYLPQQLHPNTMHTRMCDSPSSSTTRDGSTSPDICSDIEIDESCIKDEPVSPGSSCPPSPNSQIITSRRSLGLNMANMTALANSDLVFEHKNGCLQLTPASQSLLKTQSQLLLNSTGHNTANIIIPKLNIKTEPANGNATFLNGTTAMSKNGQYGLPLTPPSSLQSDDSEGNLTPEHLLSPLSPNTSVSITVATTTIGGGGGITIPITASSTGVVGRRSTSSSSSSTSSSTTNCHNTGRNINGGSTRQPIHTPLISTQPKGSTGTLILTEEEKRTLLAEGYPIPQKLPLTKAEEKSLKKIRRKIKNKISAQESRRKKKEYMDQLERRVEILVNENSDYRKRVESLEDANTNLLSQLHKLQSLVQKQNAKKS